MFLLRKLYLIQYNLKNLIFKNIFSKKTVRQLENSLRSDILIYIFDAEVAEWQTH